MAEHRPPPNPTPGTLPGNEGGAVKASPEESGVPGCGRWGSRCRGCRARGGALVEAGMAAEAGTGSGGREAAAGRPMQKGPQGSRTVGPDPCPGMPPLFEDDM